ncbi:hypothetical protein D3C78_1563740 [compost metagenome]
MDNSGDLFLHHGNQPAVAGRVYQHFFQRRNHLLQNGFGFLTICLYLGSQLHQPFNQITIRQAANGFDGKLN